MYSLRPCSDFLEGLGDVCVAVLDAVSLVADNQVGPRNTQSSLDLYIICECVGTVHGHT